MTLVRRALRPSIVATVAFTAVALVIDAFVPSASGPTSSSFATADDGLAGYAQLLRDHGHPIARLRYAPGRSTLDPSQTVVMLDPTVVRQSDIAALRRFVAAGGLLVTGGEQPGAWLSELLADASPEWSAQAPTSYATVLPVAETAGVGVVESAGEGEWIDPGQALPVIAGPSSSLVAVAKLGRGRVALLADSSPLQNRLLASADNAALGLALAGPVGRPVSFEEAVHGYGHRSGLAALPTRWKWALCGLLLAALALVCARFRRLGPPQPQPPAAQPPRREHLEAIAVALGRTGRPGIAAASVSEHARELVLRRARLDPGAGAGEVESAAEGLGLDADEARAVAFEPVADGDVLAAGRALAKLSGAPR
jgi:hypothetical protein